MRIDPHVPLDGRPSALADISMTWDWQVFLNDDGSGRTYLAWMMEAWQWTLAVAASSWVVAVSIGVVMGTLRTLADHPWLVRLANIWVELFRNIPLLVQIFLWYFVVPKIFPPFQKVPGFLLVVFALGFFTSARIAEQVRAGIQALPKGQRFAAMAMGFTTVQTYRYVILPMALRIILPPLTSESMNLLKNSSVAFAVSIAELTMFAMQAQEETSRGVEVYLAVTTLYALSAFAVNRIFTLIEAKARIPGFIVAGGTGGGH
jgi:glutamate/aspartate transport system permease protein